MKAAILRNITRLPNSVNRQLIRFNRNPYLAYGPSYRRYLKYLEQNHSYYDPTRLLIRSVNAALSATPYYRKLYGGMQVRSLAEFEQTIGFIDKDTILAHYNEFINPDIDPKDYDHGTTGGTSSKPLQLIAPKSRYIVEMATMHTIWGRAGFNFDVRAVIRNQRLADDVDYVINPITREVVFDGFRLDAEYFEKIYRIIKKYRIGFIHCYPSAAYELSTFLYNKKYDTSFIRSFLSGSENIFDYQVDLIQNRLGIRFYNWYGHSEKLILAGYCEKTNHYHVEPTYGYFELIDENRQIIHEPGRIGEMVGTGFHNPGMCFLRYRTEDFAEYVSDLLPCLRKACDPFKEYTGPMERGQGIQYRWYFCHHHGAEPPQRPVFGYQRNAVYPGKQGRTQSSYYQVTCIQRYSRKCSLQSFQTEAQVEYGCSNRVC